MFKLVEVKHFGHGHRFTFQVEAPVFLRRDEGLPLLFVPKGERVEVSIVHLHPTLGGFEAAVIHNGSFIAFHRGLTLTAEEALERTVA
jgi:hypothetical protein